MSWLIKRTVPPTGILITLGENPVLVIVTVLSMTAEVGVGAGAGVGLGREVGIGVAFGDGETFVVGVSVCAGDGDASGISEGIEEGVGETMTSSLETDARDKRQAARPAPASTISPIVMNQLFFIILRRICDDVLYVRMILEHLRKDV